MEKEIIDYPPAKEEFIKKEPKRNWEELEKKLAFILFDWIPQDNRDKKMMMKRVPDKLKIGLVIKTFKEFLAP